MLKTYRPSNRVPPTGALVLLLAILVGGMLIGGLALLVSRFFWLIILFPLGFGFLAGLVVTAIITTQNIRNPALGLIAGLLMGLVIYTTMHYGAYLQFQGQVKDVIAEEQATLPPAAQAAPVDFFLIAETGQGGFLGYLKLMAQEGVSIGRVARSNKITLNEPLTWTYWLIECALISGVAAMAGFSSAKNAFCESCQGWYRDAEPLGNVAETAKAQLLQQIQSRNFRQAGTLLTKEPLEPPTITLSVQRCRNPEAHQSLIVLKQVSRDSKGKPKFKDLLTGMIEPAELNELVRGQAEQRPETV